MSRSFLNGGTLRFAFEIAAAASVTLFPSLAHAHFTLQSPPNWTAEDSSGSPQKDWPCGNESNPSGMAPMDTGATTAFKPGDKVTIKIVETVFHPGHYRVALAPSGNMTDLPQDMSADASGGNCQNDDMETTPAFPILADGELEHTQMFAGAQSFEVTLPTDVTCDKCVLQVREYMAQHSNVSETMSGRAAGMNGCYYHHCAYISIGDGSGSGGMSGGGGAASGGASAGGSGGVGGMSTSLGGEGGMSMGGAMGQAGTLTSSAGMLGAGGAANGGRSGTAGAPGAGGTTATGGTAMTGSGGAPSGGRPSAAGGEGGSSGTGIGLTTGAPAGTSSGNTEPQASDDKGGCSMSRASRRGSLPWSAAGLFALGYFAARRRRR